MPLPNPNLKYDPGVMPTQPGFNGITDANGNLLPQYQVGTFAAPTFDQVTADPTSLNNLKEQANNTGPSAWAQMMNQQQALTQGNALDASANQNAGANANAMAGLASQGGLSGGAAERLATMSQRNNAFNQNSILRQGMSDKNQIGLQDQSQKSQILSQLPGMDMNVANLKMQNNQLANNVNQFNTGLAANTDRTNKVAAITNAAGQNAFNQGTYQQQMQAWAATQQANSDKYAADHQGSWLCTEADKTLHFKDVQRKGLSKFLRAAMKLDKETVRFYLLRCQPLVQKMKEKGADWFSNALFVLNIIELTETGFIPEAFALYCDHSIQLITKYWPECRDPSFLRIRALRAQIAKGA